MLNLTNPELQTIFLAEFLSFLQFFHMGIKKAHILQWVQINFT